MTSAPVTSWPERIALTFAVAGFAALVFAGMRRGWRHKQEVQAGIAKPLEIPADFVADTLVPGRYLASTAAGAWLTRLAVHDLGVPSRAELGLGPAGVAVQRSGARSFFIPRAALVGGRADRAIAGRAFERDGIAVATWRLGEVEVDSGFRADTTAGHLEFLAYLQGEGLTK